MFVAQNKVAGFHVSFGHPSRDFPTLVSEEEYTLRYNLIREELEEYASACVDGDIVEIADALGDLLVVVLGGAEIHGINLEPVFNEIMRSNMSKLDADGKPVPHPTVPGKIGKSDLYSPPDIPRVLDRQGTDWTSPACQIVQDWSRA